MKRTLIIAEAGVNHNGDMEIAKKLVDAAVEAKVDLVKFQTFKADTIVSPAAKKAAYQSRNIQDKDESQYGMLKKLELSDEQHHTLVAYCKKKGVEFFSTAFDIEGLGYLNELGFRRFKVPSGEITNYPYLKKLAFLKKPVILSTGMATLEEVKAALDVLSSEGLSRESITILHCNTQYPTPMEDVNLLAMHHIAKELKVATGYSDHTLGIEVPIAAVALGAEVIEKHFTLDRSMAGPDHKASLEPEELKSMVSAIRNVEQAISGSGRKEVSRSESENKVITRKSVHFSKALKSGMVITESDLIVLRPGDGISPFDWSKVIGKTLTQDVEGFSKVKWEMLSSS